MPIPKAPAPRIWLAVSWTCYADDPGHAFWPDGISLRTLGTLPVSKHLTDHYLLGLAIHHNAKLATMDQRIDATALAGGQNAYVVI